MNTPEWYFIIHSSRYGPVSTAAMQLLFQLKIISRNTLVWYDGLNDWVSASNQPGFLIDTSQPVSNAGNGGPLWYLLDRENKPCGPFPDNVVREVASCGLLPTDTYVWTHAFQNWVPVAQVFHPPDERTGRPQTSDRTVYHSDSLVDASNVFAQTHPADPLLDNLGFKPQPEKDQKTAILMRRASMIVLFLLVCLSFYSIISEIVDATTETTSETESLIPDDQPSEVGHTREVETTSIPDRWPYSFTELRHRPVSGDAFTPSIRGDMIDEVAEAYGFVLGQEIALDLIMERYPEDLRRQAFEASYRFDQVFGPAYRHMDEVLTEQRPYEWEELKRVTSDRLKPILHYNIDASYDQALQFLTEVRHRTRGNMPAPVLETLLMFHPDYITRPEREMLDGFTKTYWSDGSGKAKGLEISIEYPASWKSKEGRRPNVIQVFTSENGRGTASVNIVVRRIPEGAEGISIMEMTRDQAVEIFSQTIEGAIVDDVGLVKVAGSPALWGELHAKVDRAGIRLEVYHLVLWIQKDPYLVFLTFGAGARIDGPGTSAEMLYDHYARTFQLMINSIDFFDRY